MKTIKKIFLVALVLFLGYLLAEKQNFFKNSSPGKLSTSEAILKKSFENRKSNVQVKGEGKVTKILSDDLKGSRHQRFILRLRSGQTLLIAHNIDLAPRINSLKVNDIVAFYGEYEWNSKGGVIHWTHHDPKGQHFNGWLKHNNKTYE